jgi:hypothetical protein
MIRILVAILVILVSIMGIQVFNGTPQNKAQLFLEDKGFEKIEITGMRWLECSNYRIFTLPVGFKAQNNGKEVSGVVCFKSIVSDSSIPFLSID